MKGSRLLVRVSSVTLSHTIISRWLQSHVLERKKELFFSLLGHDLVTFNQNRECFCDKLYVGQIPEFSSNDFFGEDLLSISDFNSMINSSNLYKLIITYRVHK